MFQELELRQRLEKGLDKLGLVLEEKQIRQLLMHLAVLYKWNQVHNLTAIRSVEEMVGKHTLDSLAVLPLLRTNMTAPTLTLADVGTGAGFPGLPLAIACPEWQVTLIDSNHKKIGFVKHIIHMAKLDNVTAVASRVEALATPFDAVISRAFASLSDMVQHTAALCRDDTVLWAMKGKYPVEELSALPKPYIVKAVYPLTVPYCEGERHLVHISKELV